MYFTAVLPPHPVQLGLLAGEEALAGVLPHQLQHQLGRHLGGEPEYQARHTRSQGVRLVQWLVTSYSEGTK